MSTSTERREAHAARHLVPALLGAFVGAWLAALVVAVAGLHGFALGIVAVLVLAACTTAGWQLGRRRIVDRL